MKTTLEIMDTERASLEYTIKDCAEAIASLPGSENVSRYAQKILECRAELDKLNSRQFDLVTAKGSYYMKGM